MVFNSLQPTPLPNRLTMRGIVSVLLSVAHSDYRSLGKWYTTIKTIAPQRGVSDFDRTHRLVISGTWDVPKLVSGRNNAIRKLANGWAFSGITTFQSGLPFSILDSAAGTLFGPATLYTTGN